MAREWTLSGFEELDNRQLYQLLKLREEVFVVEQSCPYPDLDGLDQDAFHMRCLERGELLAYQRCLPPGLCYPESAIGRIVVAPAARGRSLGRELVQRGIEFNRERWSAHNIRINAQCYLRQFYRELGFEDASEEYLEDGIPHIEMLYRLNRD